MEMPALRRPALRARVPDRRQLQARGRRHRAGRQRHVHRLQVLLLGLSLRRARAGRAPEDHDQVHALRGPHLRRIAAGERTRARLRERLPDQRAPVRRRQRPRFGRFDRDPRAGRLPVDAGVGHTAGQPLPAAAQDPAGYYALGSLVALPLVSAGLATQAFSLLLAAFLAQYVGLLAERWFFFAQANHPQNLYYQTV